MVDEHSAGAVAFWAEPPGLLMIRDAYDRWTFPKGLIEKGESPREAALRELAEETGVNGRILAELGTVRYFYTRSDGEVVRKQSSFYLVQAANSDLRVQHEEIAGAEWVSPEETPSRLSYRNLQPVLGKALRALLAVGSGDELPG